MGAHASHAAATSVMSALRRLVRYLRLADRQTEARAGVSAAQAFVLRSLAQAPARSLAELASRTLTDQSSVSTVVSKLVDRGLVIRKTSANDRRRAELRLTAAGQRIARSAPRSPQPRIAEAIQALSPARRAEIVRALDVLVDAIGAGQVGARMLFEDEPRHPRRRARP
jgi:DNA-binding MarR family transcriptional regulator